MHRDWIMHDVINWIIVTIIIINNIYISISRLLKMLNLQQIGRNYYNPSDPVSIPNHRFGKNPWVSEECQATGCWLSGGVLVPCRIPTGCLVLWLALGLLYNLVGLSLPGVPSCGCGVLPAINLPYTAWLMGGTGQCPAG